jgi:hypothetical protein
MTGMVIFNVVLMAAIVLVIAGGLAWAVATQHRDHGVAAAGPLLRRQVWSRNRRAHAGSRRPLYVRPPYGTRPWPAA